MKLSLGLTPRDYLVAGGAAFVGLLDSYPNASAAYSLRKLRNNYTGNCIRVRRSSDNTEQNIGFVNNALDTTTLLTFCGVGNGFVTTWHDQSGNGYDVTQSAATLQPRIVSSGAMVTQNSKNSILFDGTDDVMLSSAVSGGFFNSSQFNVLRIPSQSGEDLPFGFGNAGDAGKVRSMYCNGPGKLGFACWAADYSSTINSVDTNLYMYSATQVNTAIVLNKNNTQVSGTLNSTPLTTVTARYGIGTLNTGIAYFTNMYGCEFIFYPSDQSSNRTGIQNNINTFYTLW